MHFIEAEDLALGAVERHQNESKSWHGLEKVRENLSTDNCGMRDFEVIATPTIVSSPFEDIQNVEPYQTPVARHPINKGELLILGSPYEDTYKLFTPADLLDFAEKCFEAAGLDKSLAFTTTLFAGRRQTICKHIPDADFKDAHGSEIKSYLNILNSLDGSWALFANISEIRTVCFNTASANIQTGGTSTKHTPESLAKFIARFPKVLEQALKDHKTSQEDYFKMADIKLNKKQAEQFFYAMLGSETKEKVSTVTYNLVNEKLLPLFVKGLGCYGDSAADAYNAVTQHYTHNFSAASNAPGGSADNYKRKAKEMLLSSGLPKHLENGKRLIATLG